MANRILPTWHGETLVILEGCSFDMMLADGTVLNVEQTADDFQIVRMNGIVAYTKPTSETAKFIESADAEETTGRN